MNRKQINHKNKQDFVVDFTALSKDYGWTVDEAIDMLGFKPKTENDLLLEYAQENYGVGVRYVPLGKNRCRISKGKLEVLCDNVYCWQKDRMYQVYDFVTKQWAEIIND